MAIWVTSTVKPLLADTFGTYPGVRLIDHVTVFDAILTSSQDVC